MKAGTHALLESRKINWGKGIRLRNDRDEVHARTETLHNLDIQRLECVTGGSNEVETCMHPQIDLLGPARLLLLQHVALVLVIEELNDGLPAVPVVHVVAKARRIDDGQSDLEELLLELCLGDLDLDGLIDLLGVAATVVGVVLDGGAEESVDEGGLAQAGFACHHDGKGSAAFGDDFVALIGELDRSIVNVFSSSP